jgi:AcrR family transcriptional regulator
MRRAPASEEGRRIVSSILEAAERLLQSERYLDISTNRIAVAAGVSVGSFYQYFPNKETVVAELARQLEQRALQLLSARVANIMNATVTEAVQEFVGVLFDARMGSLSMRRQLLEQVPRDWFADASKRVDAQVQSFVHAFLSARSSETGVGDAEAATFVLFHAVEAVVEAAVAARPTMIEDGRLRRELTTLVSAYVSQASEHAGRPTAPAGGPRERTPPLHSDFVRAQNRA